MMDNFYLQEMKSVYFFKARRHKCCWLMALVVLVSLAASGCVVKEMGTNITNSLKGEYYLKAEDPELGEESFRKEVEGNPDNPLSNYYYGRLLLRSDKAKAALPFLQKAGRLDLENAEYQFWTGVAYGRLKQTKSERFSYEQALRLDPEYHQALTALGHSYLQKKEYSQALDSYTQALKIWPENPAALYSRALVFSKMKRQEEQGAWHQYLAVNSTGGLASNAVEHLNALGDFSYRNYRLGARTVTVEKIRFVPSSRELARESRATIKMIGTTVANMNGGVLQVVVYQNNNIEMARARSQAIRKFLMNSIPALKEDKIGISWFGEPQRNTKKKWIIEESVDFFLTNQ